MNSPSSTPSSANNAVTAAITPMATASFAPASIANSPRVPVTRRSCLTRSRIPHIPKAPTDRSGAGTAHGIPSGMVHNATASQQQSARATSLPIERARACPARVVKSPGGSSAPIICARCCKTIRVPVSRYALPGARYPKLPADRSGFNDSASYCVMTISG